uniref:Uncharacterized protein n=1 Tax=Romanomermis culicivorax TaxID=13658 RepID=A0A915I0J3_ROMCU
MADFEEARFIVSLYCQMSILVCESRVNPDIFYLFKKKKVKRLAISGEVMYFECLCCNSHGNPIVISGSRSQSNLCGSPNPKLKLSVSNMNEKPNIKGKSRDKNHKKEETREQI